MLVRSEEIEIWARSYEAGGNFPRWLACLILGSCPAISHLSMPGGKGVYCGGLDGRVECENGNAFVPGGISCWELSAESKPNKKADEAYKTRIKTIPKAIRTKQIFVFATPHKWSNADDWRQDKHKQHDWKQVEVISSDRMEKWFEIVPWVARSFLNNELNRNEDGLESLNDTWIEYETVGVYTRLPSEYIIAGREDVAEELDNWLESTSGRSTLWLCGESAIEKRHFLAACVNRWPARSREMLFQRIVVVKDKSSALALRGLHRDSTVIAADYSAMTHVYKKVNESGCRLIVCCDGMVNPLHSENAEYDVIELKSPNRKIVVDLVVKYGGYQEHDAIILCQRCGFDYVKIRKERFRCVDG
jgi:hypothetical protein